MKFGIGQPLKRYEDQRLLTGKGRYTDDITLPGMAVAVVLRAPVAHARLVKVDAGAARPLFQGWQVDRAKRLGRLPAGLQ